MRLGELDLEEAAQQAAGNWQSFNSFVWFRDEIEDADNWAIMYTHHRDSGLLGQSNAEVIAKALEQFTDDDDPDVVMESHSHFLVGHIDGFSIRVFRNGEVTPAFCQYHELAEAMDCYPVLNEEDYSHREYEATIENITNSAWRMKDEYELPDGWQYEAYDWLSDHDCSEIENTDDQGGYPSEESLRSAFESLGYDNAEAVAV